jgi:hypothetical protein
MKPLRLLLLLVPLLSGCAPNFLVKPCKAPPPPDPALMQRSQVEEEIRSNLPSGTLLLLSKQGEMQTHRSGGFRSTSVRYAVQAHRAQWELFPQAISPSKQCPKQYAYYVWDRYLLCWGDRRPVLKP